MKKEVVSIDTGAPDIVWGAAAIGQIIGLNERQAYHRLEHGQIPCARKFGNMWAASRRSLLRLFAPEAVSPAPLGDNIPRASQDWQDWPPADKGEAGS